MKWIVYPKFIALSGSQLNGAALSPPLSLSDNTLEGSCMKRPGNKCAAKRKKAFMCQPAVWSLRPVIERRATRAPAALIFSFIHYIRLILIANKSKHPPRWSFWPVCWAGRASPPCWEHGTALSRMEMHSKWLDFSGSLNRYLLPAEVHLVCCRITGNSTTSCYICLCYSSASWGNLCQKLFNTFFFFFFYFVQTYFVSVVICGEAGN